jgi:two-component system KDP operon response regulator KdpE
MAHRMSGTTWGQSSWHTSPVLAGKNTKPSRGRVRTSLPNGLQLLTALVRGHGKVLTDRQQHLWGPNDLDRPHHIRIYMADLRRKLEDDPLQPRPLVTELRLGYRLVGLQSPG